jgi:photosystem II stability/assembly factor-like uncharacterized protein
MRQLRILLFSSILFLFAAKGYVQWRQVGPGSGPPVSCLVDHQNKLYAGTTNGLFVSTDAGSTWNQLPRFSHFGDDVRMLYSNYDILFAATANEDSLFCSTDGGLSWERPNSGLTNQVVSSIVEFNDQLFAGVLDGDATSTISFGGIYTSSDKGLSWQHVDSLTMRFWIDRLITHNHVLIALTNNGVYRSSPNGLNWKNITPIPIDTSFGGGFGTPCYTIEAVDKYLFVSASEGTFRSEDDGDTWTLLSSGQPPAPVGYFFSTNNIVYGSTNKGLYRSTNFGDTWNIVGVFPANAPVLSSLRVNSTFYIGTLEAGCLFKTTDNGMYWQNCSVGMSVVNVTAISGIHDKVFAGSYDGLFYYSSDNGDSWVVPKPNVAQSSIDDIFVLNDSSALIAQFQMRSTTDNGLTWKSLVDNVYISCFCRKGDTIYCGSSDGVFRSTDQGTTWGLLPKVNGVRVNSIATDGSSLFIATDSNGVLRSVDDGEHWMSLSTEPASEIRSVLFTDSVLYVAAADNYIVTIFRTSDFGETWTTITDGYNTELYSSVFLDHAIFAFGEGVVGLSTDQGKRWNNISYGLPNASVTSLYLSDRYVYVGIFNRGLWRKPLPEIYNFDKVSLSGHSKNCSIYPNPSSAAATIVVRQTEDQFVQIKIINLLGDVVAVPYSGKLSEGEHSFSWNTTTMPTGMYSCIIQRNGSIESLPIIVNH